MASIPSFNQTSTLLVIVLSVGIVISLRSYQGEEESSPITPAEEFSQQAGAEVSLPFDTVPSEAVLGYESSVGELPRSFTGTRLVQRLHVDGEGHLRLSGDLRDIFDYFLSGIAEEPLETVLARIDEYLEYHLSEPALGEAKSILSQYIALKSSLYEYEKSMAERLPDFQNGEVSRQAYLELLKDQLDTRNQLRQQYLEQDVHELFYAEEEQYDQFTYDRLVLMADENLSAEDKQLRLDALEDNLPETVVASMRETEISDTLKTRTQSILNNGGSHEEIRELRREMFGEEAVQRFDELDQQRSQWQHRIDSYMRERDVLVQATGITESERQLQIDQLRSQHFDEREQIRVQVVERSADQVNQPSS